YLGVVGDDGIVFDPGVVAHLSSAVDASVGREVSGAVHDRGGLFPATAIWMLNETGCAIGCLFWRRPKDLSFVMQPLLGGMRAIGIAQIILASEEKRIGRSRDDQEESILIGRQRD